MKLVRESLCSGHPKECRNSRGNAGGRIYKSKRSRVQESFGSDIGREIPGPTQCSGKLELLFQQGL